MAKINKTIFDQLLPPTSKTLGFVWRIQQGWPISSCSESAIRKLGLNFDEVNAGTLVYKDLIHPDDVQRVSDVIERGFAGQLTDGEKEAIEYRLRCGDGSWVWVESETNMSVFGEPNNLIVMGFLQDVTARHETETALKKNQDRLELILEGTEMGMWDWNPQTNEAICDKRWAAQLGLTLDDLTMQLTDWSSRVHPDDLDDCLKAIEDHLQGKTPVYENVHRLKHADGHWVYILDRGKVFERDEQDRPTKFIGTHTDVSHLKKVELEALEALNARDRFFSAMSHELRTPLHAILGTVELLESELEDEQQRNKINLVRESGEHLLSVLKDILDVAKLEEGELSLHLSRFYLSDILTQVTQLFASRAEQKSLSLQTCLPASLNSGIESDRTRVLQVLVNLISNAVKYTQQGGVTVTLLEAKGDLIVTVADTGAGIADVDEVFRPYRQSEATLIDDVHTTGLGLPIVQHLVDLLGIQLSVETEVGRGSEFKLRFPVRLRRASVAHSEVTLSEPQFIDWTGINVLLVDDNKVNQIVASAMLDARQVDVTLASDGHEAIEKLKQARFDVVCMDLHMPELGGLSATRQIRRLALEHQPKIIGVSADAYEDTIKQCLSAGMDHYLTKPFRRNDLFAALQEVLTDKH